MSFVLIALGIVSAGYGVTVMLVNSGSPFYLVWYAIGAVLAGTGASSLLHPDTAAIRYLRWAVCALTLVGAVGAGALSALIMNTAHAAPPANLDYLLVLGAQVRADRTPAESLRYRLESAVAYLDDNPQTRVIVSGGQGPNEPCPEAEAMRDWLLAHGIAEERILAEDQSSTTAENVAFSARLIDPARDTVGVVTNDFHVWRAVRIAQRGGLEHTWGIAAYSHPWYLPNNLLRECFAIAKNTLMGTM